MDVLIRFSYVSFYAIQPEIDVGLAHSETVRRGATGQGRTPTSREDRAGEETWEDGPYGEPKARHQTH